MDHRPGSFLTVSFLVMACAALLAPDALAQDAAVRADSAEGRAESGLVGRDAAVQPDSAAAGVVLARIDSAICPYDVQAAFDGALTSQNPQTARPFGATPRPQPRFTPPRTAFSFANTASAPARVFENDPADPTTVELDIERLHGDGTRLDGQFVRVRSTQLDTDGMASPGLDGTADFRFDPNLTDGADCPRNIEDCPRFDAVNVYYHIDKFAQEFWTERMGVDIAFQADVQIHIEGDGGIANPALNEMYLRWGQLFNKNAALSDDLMYHEYSHLVTNALGFHVTFDNAESRALSEAMADYFALTYTDDPRFGEWLVTCPSSHDCPRAQENDPDLRTMVLDPFIWNWKNGEPEDTLKYGFCLRKNLDDGKCKPSYNNHTNTYTWAMIWGGAQWRLRNQIGADALDPMVLDAMLRFEPYITFERALGHLIQVDRDRNGGVHEEIIRDVFGQSGIEAAISDDVEGPPEVPTDAFSVEVWPQPAAERVRVAISGDEGRGFAGGRGGESRSERGAEADGEGWMGNEGRVWTGGSVEISLFDVTGRRVLRETHVAGGGAGRVDVELDIGQIMPGVYGLRIVSGGQAVHRPIVISR